MPRHLLEVVEDHQAAAAPGDGMAELHHRIVTAERNVETQGHRAHDAVEAARGRQIAEPDAAWKLAEIAAAVARHQARLAGAAEAEHRHEARARLDALGQPVQCLGAPDEGVALGWQTVPDLAHRRLAVRLGNRHGKPITPSGNGGHGLRTEQLAQRRDVDGQVVFLDHHTGPDQLEKFALADHPVAVLDQAQQKIERARTQHDRRPPAQHTAFVGPNLELTDRVARSQVLSLDVVPVTARDPSEAAV